jgi:hypothetical protein
MKQYQYKIQRSLRFGYLNGLIDQDKHYKPTEITDLITITKAKFPKKYKAKITTVTEGIPEKFKINKTFYFGDQSHQHYFDKIGEYSSLNHNDKNRQKKFDQRFYEKMKVYPSSSWLSKTFLW